MNKYEKALNYLEKMTRGKVNNTEQYHNDKSSLLAILDLQELIDICSKPNSIKQKLDHIQDVLDCCYETDINGKHYESDWNDDVSLADEELQDIKQAYSFRVEDTRIVNELSELLNCNVDSIKGKVQTLEKALDKIIKIVVQNEIKVETDKPIGKICSVSINDDKTYLVQSESEWKDYLLSEVQNGK